MEKINIDGICFDAENGKIKRIVLTGNNLKRELDIIKEHNISGIVFNRFFCEGRITSTDFLRDFPNIQDVVIANDDFDCSGLYYLKQLKELRIKGRQFIDYSIFPSLRLLSCDQDSPFSLPDSLEILYIRGCQMKALGLRSFSFPNTLKELHVISSYLVDLDTIPSSIENLEISFVRQLISIDGISNCSESLRNLEIQNCPNILNYSVLCQCTNVEKLLLNSCGSIQDLNFIKEMPKLIHFSFPKTRVINNDLSLLWTVPYVFFTNNAEYNYRLKDFPCSIADLVH